MSIDQAGTIDFATIDKASGDLWLSLAGHDIFMADENYNSSEIHSGIVLANVIAGGFGTKIQRPPRGD